MLSRQLSFAGNVCRPEAALEYLHLTKAETERLLLSANAEVRELERAD